MNVNFNFIMDINSNFSQIIGAMIAAIVVVAGWFWIAYLNRKNEIAKELRQHKIKLLVDLFKLVRKQRDLNKNEQLTTLPDGYWDLYYDVTASINSFCNEDIIAVYYEVDANALDKEDINKHFESSEKCKKELINDIREGVNLEKLFKKKKQRWCHVVWHKFRKN
ncbi:MAG: hypothetical protein LBU91_08745 [Bacteroidales bacterium]|jgi:type II secretory pathway component PulF|nr:hypothetical protein [Bacteroidales bacterium]